MCFPAVRNILHRSAILLLTKEVWKKLYVCLLIMKLKGKKYIGVPIVAQWN